jgi:GT2 family glycosyltransferase
MNSIIIPAANSRSHCKKMLYDCLRSIELGGYLDEYSVVVCLDGTDDRFNNYFTQLFPFIKTVINKGKNLGFAANANAGLRFAGGPAFVLNMDTIVPHSRFMNKITEIDGLATPRQVDLNPDKKVLSEEELVETIANLDKMAGDDEFLTRPSKKFAGFCMWFGQALLDKCGILDEGFISTFEDDDLTARAVVAKIPCFETNVPVHHYISNRTEISTTGAYTQDRMNLSMFRMRMKWQIPPEIPHSQFNEWIERRHDWSDEMKEV